MIADEYKKRALVRPLFCVLIFCERMCKCDGKIDIDSDIWYNRTIHKTWKEGII